MMNKNNNINIAIKIYYLQKIYFLKRLNVFQETLLWINILLNREIHQDIKKAKNQMNH